MYKNILVGIDGSPASLKALEKAAEIAKQFNGKLYLVMAVPPIQDFVATMTPIIEGAMTAIEENARKTLEEAKKLAAEKGAAVEEVAVETGGAGHVVLNYAEKVKADLIVVGKRGKRSWIDKLVGSVASDVFKHAETDVLVVEYRGEG
ncbi:MAG: universal stress protein [Desulfurococcales archaeon]|nr:universal stress protein [Desulfurococcales archaeon]